MVVTLSIYEKPAFPVIINVIITLFLGFVATGVIAMQYESKGANTHTIHLSGLIW